jgi:aminopeptidase YwaD
MTFKLPTVLGEIWQSSALHADMDALCEFGGRLCGTESEKRAVDFLKERLQRTGARQSTHDCEYKGWKREHTRLQIGDGKTYYDVPTVSLQHSPDTPPGGLELEVVDVARGAVEEFKAVAKQVRGRAALAHHEYFFSQTHIPRRRKYGLSKEFGAKAFLIANHLPGAGPVNGIAGRPDGEADDIPSVGMSYESGEWLARLARTGTAKVKIEVKATRGKGVSPNIIAEIPGQTDEWVVLSAHYDGQSLGQAAMDNGSGTIAALEAFRQLAPYVPNFRRGLRVIFFTLEHWGLLGSRLYVRDQSKEDLRKIAFALNLDTVCGGRRLSACTSGHEDVDALVKSVTATNGVPLSIVRALQINSDHYNFHLAGVPSMRLIAGYEDADSNARFMMSSSDTRDKVEAGELLAATMTATKLVVAACNNEFVANHIDPSSAQRDLDMTDPWVSDRVNAKR